MPSVMVKVLLFISSYFPLLIIITIKNFEVTAYWYLIPALIGVIALVVLSMFIKWTNGMAAREEVVSDVQRKDSEVMSYIVTYIFPFMDIKFAEPKNLICLMIFFAILMVIYVNSNMIHINPILNLSGYHIYEIETSTGRTHTVITKRNRFFRNSKIQVVMIGDDLFMEKSIESTSRI